MKQTKNTICFIAVFAMILSLFQTAALADTQTTTFEKGSDEKYHIRNVDDLVAFRDMVNGEDYARTHGETFAGETVVLDSDIDLSKFDSSVTADGDEEGWLPIGYWESYFAGTFDGQGHTVSNLYAVHPYAYNYGFFANVTGENAVVKNLTINNAEVEGDWEIGGIVGAPYCCTIENCHVTGTINITANSGGAGAISGYGYVSILNCSVDGTSKDKSKVWGYTTYVGGIAGWCGEGNFKIQNCSAKNITVSGNDRVGGITGIAHYGNTISDCTISNVDIIVAEDSSRDDNIDYNSGGYIAGYAPTDTTKTSFSTIINCKAENISGTYGKEVVELPAVAGDSANSLIGTNVTFDENGKYTGGSFKLSGAAKLDGKTADGFTTKENEDGTVSVETETAVITIIDTDKYIAQDGTGNIRYLTKAEIGSSQTVERYGTWFIPEDIFKSGQSVTVERTDALESGQTFTADLLNIPQTELQRKIIGVSFIKLNGVDKIETAQTIISVSESEEN